MIPAILTGGWWSAVTNTAAGALTAPARGWMAFTIDEPDVSLSDYALALETACFAVIIARLPSHRPRLRGWSAAFFAAASIASVAGGTDHGFFRRDGRESGHDLLWATSLLAIGAAALALVGFGAVIGLSRTSARRLITITAVVGVAYALAVVVGWRSFLIAIVAYVPAALFLLAILIRQYARHRDRASLLGIAAVVLALIAAAVQQGEIGIHPRLGHNAFYHLIQGVSFAVFLGAARGFLTSPNPPESG